MSAKWAILSTVFVPMLLIAGISPAATQMAYRVGDSLTNNITPTFAYLGIILTYAQKYDRRAQTGTVIAYMLPFSISFTIVWVGSLIIWTLLGLPIGPRYHVFYRYNINNKNRRIDYETTKKLLGTAVVAMLALSACSSQPTTPVAPTGESGPENTAELQTEAKGK